MEINDERIQEWVDKCPEHDNQILHSDDKETKELLRKEKLLPE